MRDWKLWRGRSAAVAHRRGLLGGLAAVLALIVLVNLVLGWYWSREPDFFPVQQHAQDAATASGRKLVLGYTTVETLKQVVGTLLDKPGGYLSNDVFPPGVLLDNMPSWEYGVLVQVRDLSRALRKDFTRSQSQSTEDPDLAQAEPHFNFDNRSWAVPSSESEYRAGMANLDRYLARLGGQNTAGQPNAYFYSRADNLRNWLGDVETRLGSLSQRLSASVGRVRLDAEVRSDQDIPPGQVPEVHEQRVETPWLQIDNVFYEARGQAWALSHLLRAIEVDFADTLAKKNATVNVREIIRELEAAQQPVWSPVILNGSGFGILANHSLVIANYISRANAAIIDLRQLLEQG